jgi:signal transduction histidine kinase/serine phosphatase RsbU (regulator of sigma subunit)/DNA-binding response OmpR family regulator/anti-sigma regulatory factor (Ser/Thr protein kinase)
VDHPGGMSDRIAAFDWSATPLGPAAGWPQSLQAAVRIVLGSRFSMWMAWGPELTFFYNDAYAADTLASKHPWALGKRADEVWAEIWGDIGPRIGRVMASGTATWDEGLRLFLERSGYREETYHTFSYSPLRDERGDTAGMLCVVVEETDRVLGERRLATLRELAEATGTAAGERDLFAAVDRTLAANPYDLPFAFAYTAGEAGALVPANAGAPGWPDAALLAGEPAVVELAGRPAVPSGAWEEPPRQAFAIPLAERGGSEPAGLVLAGLNPYRALDEEYRGFLELVAGQIASSLSNVRAREAERERAEALAELDRAKTDFFSNVSHEFRTPLSLILGPAEDALAEAGDGEQRERLGVVFRNALRLQKLVNNLLEFSRIEAGRAEPLREPTDLAAFTTDLASMFRAATDRAGIALVVERPDGPVVARVDREMWERIVLNLVSNAFKFTFEGEIRVTLRRDGADAVLSVADTGTGIAADELSSLFARFKRVRGARSRTHEGSGIGLALVQELTRLHGGRVTAVSEPGAGSTFSVRVPLEEAADPAAAAATPTSGAAAYLEEALRWLPDAEESVGELDAVGTGLPSDGPETERARILIADDNADLRDYLERLLARHWDVETVRDGRAALEAVQARRPDLILSDAMMPELDGFGLLARLRSDPATSQLPVIMLSARAGEEAAVEGLAAGADDYLVKPFSSRELIARVRANLDLAEMRQAAARATERHARLLRDLADAAVDINRAATVADVLEVMAERARTLVGAERAVARLDGAGEPGDAPFGRRVALTGAGGRPLGELLLDGGESNGGVEADSVLTQLALLAATRLENALLYEREHRVAETLQRSLLPESVPQFERAELAALYLPGSSEASVGGDWYDAIALDDGTLGLVIGDVVGRGVRAASAMGQLRNAVRAYLLEGYGPAQTLARVNHLLDTLGGGFATLACLCVDTATGTLRYANAGHPPPLIVGPDGATRWLEDGLAPPIGAAREIAYRQAEDTIPDGGALVLYTDGLVERRGEPIDTGLSRVAEAASDSPAHAVTLARRLVAAMPGSARPDDVAVLALSRREAAGEPLVVRLPAEATSLAPLRERLRRWLVAEGWSRADAGDVLLAVGEAASNAIEHALEPSPAAVVVTLARGGEGETNIEIRDHGHWDAEPSQPHRGRGMQIMQAVATGDVAIDRSEQGTTVRILHRRGDGTA